MGNENGKGKEVEEGEMKRRRGRGRESRRGNEMGKEGTGKVKCETGNDEGGGLEESFRSLLFQAILSFRTNHKVMARQSYFHAFSVDKNSRRRCHIAGYPRQSAKRKAQSIIPHAKEQNSFLHENACHAVDYLPVSHPLKPSSSQVYMKYLCTRD